MSPSIHLLPIFCALVSGDAVACAAGRSVEPASSAAVVSLAPSTGVLQEKGLKKKIKKQVKRKLDPWGGMLV